ncbi:MAG: CRISPR-associated protein Cas4 [Brevinematales bacterium]|nr:CRISPR-associated protein Cas4 [Brevinematales bacterium]
MLFEIPISLIRQHLFCPRIPYFILLGFGNPDKPVWVRQGGEIHKESASLFLRRSLSKFGLEKADKKFYVKVFSKKYGLIGEIDMVLNDGEFIYPVEFKTHGHKPEKSHILQLVAYGLCLEEETGLKFQIGFIAYRDENKVHRIEANEEHRTKVIRIAEEIKNNIERRIHPDTPATANQCVQCEWVNFCNDRL